MIDITPFADDITSDLPIKVKTTHTFGYDSPPKTISPPPSCAKISDINIDLFFQNEEVKLDEINSLTALALLNLLITTLVVESELNKEISDVGMTLTDSSSDDCNDQESPLSPKKRSLSGPQVLDTAEPSQQDVRPEQNITLLKGFSLKSPPDLCLTQYLERINQYCGLSAAVYLATSFHIYKIAVEEGLVKLNNLNVHRLVIAALRISCKALEDINHKQPFIAKIGGINLKDLQFLEISFLFLINFECHVDSSALITTVKKIKDLYQNRS